MDGWFYLTWMWTLDCKSVSNDWHDHCWLGQHGWFYMILDVNSWFRLFDNFWLTDFWERTGTGGSLNFFWNKGRRLFPWFPFPKNLSQRGSNMFFKTGNRRFLIHSLILMIWLLGIINNLGNKLSITQKGRLSNNQLIFTCYPVGGYPSVIRFLKK